MAELLIAVSWRSLVLAALAGLALSRQRSAAARHAVWTLVTAGMPAMAVAIAMLPVIPVRVIRPAVRPVNFAIAAPVPFTAAPTRTFPWETTIEALYAIGIAVFAGRLAYGYRLTSRLARASRRVERFEDAVYESERVTVPLTTGWLRPRIFLPAEWERWAPDKLHAVLIHERNHVRRGDWAIAALAAINRCVFWFHPLAWWLEARLKVLAEEACDDASLPYVASRELYAQVLVEIAAALRGGGRVAGDVVAMAKGAEVGMRVERILDESRTIAPAMTRGRWAMLVCCAAPMIYLAAVMRPARVQAQDPPAAAQPAVSAPAAGEDPATLKGRDNVAQQNSMQMMLEQNTEELRRLQQERIALETQLQGLKADSGALMGADERVRELEAQLAAARETFTARHPSVRRLEEQLAVERVRGAADRRKALELERSADLLEMETQNLNLQMDERVKQAAQINRQIEAGKVQLRVTFGADGKPEKIEVLRGQGAEQAVEWAKTLRSGQTGPRVITLEVPVNK
uniref:Peptidase M56, BlaR1 n=1 Tax=Solibacter usitatus (strain Ellin6076) TaxID=234267 RepID=Q01YI0_SOLUE